MKNGYIYALKSLIDQRVYIGQSVQPESRRNEHFSKLRRGNHENKYLQNFYNKYGDFALGFFILEKCPLEELTDKEQEYIDVLHSSEMFNINKDAARPPKPKKGRISEAGLKALREKIPWNKGKRLTKEHRERIAEGCKGVSMPASQIESTRQRMIKSNPSHNPESLRKMALAKLRFTEDQCIEIAEKYIPYEYSARKLADEYGVDRASIRNALKYHNKYLNKEHL